VILGVRPEHLAVNDGGDGEIRGTVRITERLGAETILYVDVPGAEPIVVRGSGAAREKAGEAVKIGVGAATCHLFAPDGPALVNASAN
jgi:multiple sugar transport system ATP-binding protein